MKNSNNILEKLFKEAKRTKPKLKLTAEQMDKLAENQKFPKNQNLHKRYFPIKINEKKPHIFNISHL